MLTRCAMHEEACNYIAALRNLHLYMSEHSSLPA